MGRVQVLDVVTANQIAAGEVVERPASVVKELIENSIDAGAAKIEVEVRSGGRELIKIQDDGFGMTPDDAELCLERHATSKIRSVEDLGRIISLGFRGEALPSIAGVSRFELRTWTGEGEMGTSVVVEGGVKVKVSPVSTAKGTAIWVRDLFYNTPARYKFMKTKATENRAILETVGHLALAHPEVSIRFSAEGKEILSTSGSGELIDAINKVMGRDIAKELLPVEMGDSRLSVVGYASRPQMTRANRSTEVFFLNGRFVRSKVISAAVERAYDRVIPAGKFPAAVLCLTIDPASIDVNVHPTKTEVKFEDESEVFRLVHRAVAKVTAGSASLWGIGGSADAKPPEMREDLSRQTEVDARPSDNLFLNDGFQVQREGPAQAPVRQESQGSRHYPESPQTGGSQPYRPAGENRQSDLTAQPQTSRIPETREPAGYFNPDPAPRRIPTPVVAPRLTDIYSDRQPIERKPSEAESRFTILGQILDTYIVCADSKGLVLIDQHNSHERVIYEQLKASLAKRRKGDAPQSQGLLVPLVLELTAAESAVLDGHLELLGAIGFDIANMGDNRYSISSLPLQFGGTADADDLREFIDEMAEAEITGGPRVFAEREDRLMISLSCKTAIKAGKHLEKIEMEALLAKLLVTERPFTCPHGRPTVVKIERDELEKRFGRK